MCIRLCTNLCLSISASLSTSSILRFFVCSLNSSEDDVLLDEEPDLACLWLNKNEIFFMN